MNLSLVIQLGSIYNKTRAKQKHHQIGQRNTSSF